MRLNVKRLMMRRPIVYEKFVAKDLFTASKMLRPSDKRYLMTIVLH